MHERLLRSVIMAKKLTLQGQIAILKEQIETLKEQIGTLKEQINPLKDLTLKEQTDILMTLSDHAWKSFDARRAYEWKLSLGIWTALAAFSGVIVSSEHEFKPNVDGFIFFAISAMSVITIQYYCLYRILLGNRADTALVRAYREKIHKLVDCALNKDAVVKNAMLRAGSKKGTWSLVFHVGVTCCLLSACYGALLMKATDSCMLTTPGWIFLGMLVTVLTGIELRSHSLVKKWKMDDPKQPVCCDRGQ